MANTPTIIIGLGSSGYHIIKETQKFYFENFKKNKPDHVEYLYIETFTGEKNFIPDSELDIQRVYTSLSNIELMVKEVKKYSGTSDWLPPNEQLVDAGAGAGGIRPCGRLALWGHNDEGDNFKNVVNAIKHAHAKVRSFTQPEDVETQPIVYIVGTLVGGTASGMFIDMGYLVRHLISNVRFVFGLFLLPPTPSSIRGNEHMYANSYGALKELDTYNNIKYKYKEKLPSGTIINEIGSPFDYSQLISQDYQDGSPALDDVSGLVKMAGLFTFLNIAGMYNKRRERFVDAKANGIIRNYGTFCLSAIQYPKDQIEEYIACQLSKNLLEKWLDTEKANSKPINTGSIETDIAKKWNKIINQAFKKLDIIGDEDIVKRIETESRKINNKNINENEYDYIKKLFSSNQSDKLYGKIKGNISEAVNFIIDEIYDLNVKTLNDYENITYTQKVLESLINSMTKTIQFWKKHEMSSDTQSWENFLRNQCTWMLKERNKLVFEQNNTLYDRMLSTLTFMKMHLLGKTIFELMAFMDKKDAPFKSNKSGKALPKINDLTKLYGIIAEIHGKRESLYYSVKKRMGEIVKDINDTTIPILRVYSSGSFDKDAENALTLFTRKKEIYSNSRKDITNQDLWELFKNPDKLQNKLFDLLLYQYKEKVSNSGVVGDYDVTRYVKDNITKGIDMAKRATIPFIATKDLVFQQSKYLPKLSIASDDASLTEILNNFSNNGFHEFKNASDNKLELRDVKNILVFYEEKAVPFIPLKHISYIEQMKEVYEKTPTLYKDGMSDDMWHNFRNAYIPVLNPNAENEGDDQDQDTTTNE